jgi:hypothetical protein
MPKLTLDLNGLNVESFSADDTAAANGLTGDHYAVTPFTLTNRICCEAAVEACTVRNPCCDETP